MAEEMQFFAESSMRGYHAYYKDVKVSIGEVMFCEVENDNEFDEYAVALNTEFLQNYGEIEAECIGVRYNSGDV